MADLQEYGANDWRSGTPIDQGAAAPTESFGPNDWRSGTPINLGESQANIDPAQQRMQSAKTPEERAHWQKVIANAQQAGTPSQHPQRGMDSISTTGGAAAAMSDGALLGFGDEYLAGLSSVLGVQPDQHGGANWFDYEKPIGERYETALGAIRDEQSEFNEKNPKTAFSAEVAGSLMIPGRAAAQAITSAPTRIGQMGRGAGLGMAAGATYGFAEGEGGAGERMADVPAGVAVGGTLGLAGPVGVAGLQYAVSAMKGSSIAKIAKKFGISRQAAETISNALENDDTAKAMATLQRAGDSSMLADAGPASKALLDASVASGGAAGRIARDAIEERASAASVEMGKTLDRYLGTPVGVKKQAEGIAARTSAQRSEAYNLAYSKPINYASTQGKHIEAVLARVPKRILRSAIDEANEAMQANGVKNAQIMAEIADNGKVTFREMPNVQQLDEIKKALGTAGAESVDQFGRKTAQGMRSAKLAKDLGDSLQFAVPEYRKALRLGGDKIAEDNALRLGTNLFRSSREDFQRGLFKASRTERDAAKRGLRQRIDDTLANVSAVISDPNTDARELMKLARDMSSRSSRDKMRTLLGGSKANALAAELEKAVMSLDIRAAIARNSQTAIRQSIQGTVKDLSAPNLVESLASGEAIGATKRLVQVISGTTPEARALREQGIYDEIAQFLTETRGPQAQQALRSIRAAKAGQVITEYRANQIARAVTGALQVGAYQGARQLQNN